MNGCFDDEICLSGRKLFFSFCGQFVASDAISPLEPVSFVNKRNLFLNCNFSLPIFPPLWEIIPDINSQAREQG